MLSNSFPKCVFHLHCHQQCMRIPVVHSLLVLCFFTLAILVFVSHMDFHFSDDCVKYWTPFHMFIGLLGVLSFVSSTFPHFFCCLGCLCLMISKSALYNLNIGSTSDLCIANIFLVCFCSVYTICAYCKVTKICDFL